MRHVALLAGPLLLALSLRYRRGLTLREALVANFAGPAAAALVGGVSWLVWRGDAQHHAGYAALGALVQPFFLAAYTHLLVCASLVAVSLRREGGLVALVRLGAMVTLGGLTLATLALSNHVARPLSLAVEALALSAAAFALQAGYCLAPIPRVAGHRGA